VPADPDSEFFKQLLSKRRQAEREELVDALAVTLIDAATRMGVYAMVFRFPRYDGAPASDVGQDDMEGLATVVAIAGSLVSACADLLRAGNQYAAWALIRQLVEVEYLAWAFAESRRDASDWLNSDRDQRLQLWQPRHLRRVSAGRFGAEDYSVHCEFGGHPTPEARNLLPGPSQGQVEVGWHELCFHGDQIWEWASAALGATDIGRVAVTSAIGVKRLERARRTWRKHDKLRALALSGDSNDQEPID